MESKTALWAAIVAGALAVAIVAADVMMNVTAFVEVREDGEWYIASSTEPDAWQIYGERCGGEALRVRLDNTTPLGAERAVEVTYNDQNGTTMLYETTLQVDAWGSVTSDSVDIPDGDGNVQVRVGDWFAHTCLRRPGVIV